MLNRVKFSSCIENRNFFFLLLRKLGVKGVCLHKWWGICCMRCIVFQFSLNKYPALLMFNVEHSHEMVISEDP